MPSLNEARLAKIRDAKAIALAAKAENRDLTKAEIEQVDTLLGEIETFTTKIANAKESEDLLDRLGSLDGTGGHHPVKKSGVREFLDLSPEGRSRMAGIAAKAMVAPDRKSLLPAGEQYVSIPTIPASPVSEGKVANTLLSVLPVVQIPQGKKAQYWRQTVRTNNAAFVPEGQQKPTSLYGNVKIDIDLGTYAHLSEALDKYAIEDGGELSAADSLANWLVGEMTYGLLEAVETDCLTGTAAAGGIIGILQTSGIRTIAFDVDILTTTRHAVTAAETLGYFARPGFIMSPADWEACETARAQTSGVYLMNSAPQERPVPTLWGVGVVISNGLPADTAILADFNSLALYTDKAGVKLDWWSPGNTWELNQIKAREEGRFDLAVYQPAACALIHTAATTP